MSEKNSASGWPPEAGKYLLANALYIKVYNTKAQLRLWVQVFD